MNDLMIDLETYGLTLDSSVRSIGACFFDIESDAIGEKFYVNIDLESCLKLNLHVNPQTKAWWAMQGKEAKEVLEVDQQPVKKAIESFRRWIITNTADKTKFHVWSNGVNFDLPILNFVQAQLRLKPAWNYWNERDTRTLLWIAGDIDIPFVGTPHNALDDALHQARQIQAGHRKIFPGGRPIRETEKTGTPTSTT